MSTNFFFPTSILFSFYREKNFKNLQVFQTIIIYFIFLHIFHDKPNMRIWDLFLLFP